MSQFLNNMHETLMNDYKRKDQKPYFEVNMNIFSQNNPSAQCCGLSALAQVKLGISPIQLPQVAQIFLKLNSSFIIPKP